MIKKLLDICSLLFSSSVCWIGIISFIFTSINNNRILLLFTVRSSWLLDGGCWLLIWSLRLYFRLVYYGLWLNNWLLNRLVYYGRWLNSWLLNRLVYYGRWLNSWLLNRLVYYGIWLDSWLLNRRNYCFLVFVRRLILLITLDDLKLTLRWNSIPNNSEVFHIMDH